MAFDSNMAPVVGQQITLTSATAATAGPRIALFEARADAHECDLVVHGRTKHATHDFTYAARAFVSGTGVTLSDAEVRALLDGSGGSDALTFTCAPPGSGWRAGVDRDGDGYADAVELAFGTDPSAPGSHP